jgi:hypothetical protein
MYKINVEFGNQYFTLSEERRLGGLENETQTKIFELYRENMVG